MSRKQGFRMINKDKLKSQLSAELEATVIMKLKSKTLEITKAKEYAITDGWRTCWIMFYPDGSWSVDTNYISIPKAMKEKLNKIGINQRNQNANT